MKVQWQVTVENKIKASESDRQLANYDESLSALAGNPQKIFLTLSGEQPNSGREWQAVPYSVLNEALSQQASCRNNPYLHDLCKSIGRLTAVAEAACSDGGLAAFAFGDDDGVACAPELLAYVESMRLNKIVQRIWMNGVLNKVSVKKPWRSGLSETHAQAILDIEAALSEEPKVVVGLQLQWRTLKVFCRPDPYPSVATPEQNKKVDDILMRIRDMFHISGKRRPTQPRARGFRSFTLLNMPNGRNAEDWAGLLRKQLEILYAAFPDAREIYRVDVIADGAED